MTDNAQTCIFYVAHQTPAAKRAAPKAAPYDTFYIRKAGVQDFIITSIILKRVKALRAWGRLIQGL